MLIHLLDAYLKKTEIKYWETFKKLDIKIKIAFITMIVFWLVYAFFPKLIVRAIAIGIVLITIIFLHFFIRKIEKNNYRDYYEKYNDKLKILRNLLKDEFNIYSKSQVEILINQSLERLNKLKNKENYFLPIIRVFTTLIIPIIIYGFNIYRDTIPKEEQLVILAFAVAVIIMSLGIYYMVKPTIDDLSNSYYNKLYKLKNMLEDIILIDFSDKS